MTLFAFDDLVDTVRPGDRVEARTVYYSRRRRDNCGAPRGARACLGVVASSSSL